MLAPCNLRVQDKAKNSQQKATYQGSGPQKAQKPYFIKHNCSLLPLRVTGVSGDSQGTLFSLSLGTGMGLSYPGRLLSFPVPISIISDRVRHPFGGNIYLIQGVSYRRDLYSPLQ